MKKELGKITSVRFGLGGYQDVMFGLSLTFNCGGACVDHFEGMWSPSHVTHTKSCKWTEASRSQQFDELVRNIDKYIHQAKVREIHQLNGIPVEVTFDGMQMQGWRILTEVL